MVLKDSLDIWWNLSFYYKWELLGVWVGFRCCACGAWKWESPCWASPHWRQEAAICTAFPQKDTAEETGEWIVKVANKILEDTQQ